MREGIFGFIGGVIAGAVAAMLLTPEKGEKMRKNIKKIVEDTGEVIKKNADIFIEEGKKHLDKITSANQSKGKKS
jgi:gas vesicle protein